jgi:hypothetical protein
MLAAPAAWHALHIMKQGPSADSVLQTSDSILSIIISHHITSAGSSCSCNAITSVRLNASPFRVFRLSRFWLCGTLVFGLGFHIRERPAGPTLHQSPTQLNSFQIFMRTTRQLLDLLVGHCTSICCFFQRSIFFFCINRRSRFPWALVSL